MYRYVCIDVFEYIYEYTLSVIYDICLECTNKEVYEIKYGSNIHRILLIQNYQHSKQKIIIFTI